MIQKQEGLFVVHCDECTEYLETGCDDFHDAIQYLKDEQWRISKDEDDEWIHLCTECA